MANETVNPAGSPKVKEQPPSKRRSEFDKFKDLTRGLVSVPKKELDQQSDRAKKASR